MTESQFDTLDHINKVRSNLEIIVRNLRQRELSHDASKLEEPEASLFAEISPQLSTLEYGGAEYMAALARLKPAIEHHYQRNSHHPEHTAAGIAGMSLLDIIEMIADWQASGQRYKNGNMAQSLEVNIKRFGIDEQLASILVNTARELGWL